MILGSPPGKTGQEMALFPMSCVLRGFAACDVLTVHLGGNPCAALLIEKIAHFQILVK